MNTALYLKLLRDEIHSATFATIGADGHPQTRIIDVMLTGDDSLFFLTAKGKEFYRQLMEQEYVAISGTKGKVAISLRGKVRRVGQELLDEMFRQNPYMAEIYPGGTRSALDAFQLYEGQGEYFDLNRIPIFRDTFLLGGARQVAGGYTITGACTGCGTCAKACPQQCIDSGEPFAIRQENCLHCGRCAEVCPVGAAGRASL